MSDNNLSPIKRTALALINTVRAMVINDCDDETIAQTIPKINIAPKKGIVAEDYMSYDDAIKELGIGYNRNRLSKLARKYGIVNHRFRNMPIGFHKDDIAKLKNIISRNNS